MPGRPRITTQHTDTLLDLRQLRHADPLDPHLDVLIEQAIQEGEALDNLFATVSAMVRTGLDSRRVRDLKRDRALIRWNDQPTE